MNVPSTKKSKSQRPRNLASATPVTPITRANARSAIEEELFDIDFDNDDDFDIDTLSANFDDVESPIGGGVGSNIVIGNSQLAYDGSRGSSNVDRSDFDFNTDFDLQDMSNPISKAHDMEEVEYEEYGQGSEKGALYDAYNLLHTLAQVRKSSYIYTALLKSLVDLRLKHDSNPIGFTSNI